jgi:hypothetical protein
MKTPMFLLAYEFDEKEILLLDLGVHENFYRDLKLLAVAYAKDN